MGCITETENGKTRAVLTFKREQLQYDIDNGAYIEGSVLPRETEPHNRHMVQDVGQAGNVDRVTRVLEVEMARVREMLYPFTRHKVHRPELDDILRRPGIYGIVLELPGDFSQTTLNLLEKLIHEYLVCRALEDWMSITNPGKAETWALKAEGTESRIRRSIGSRMGPTRRKLHPF